MKRFLTLLPALCLLSSGYADQPSSSPPPVLESVVLANGGKTLVVSFSTNGTHEKLSFDFPEAVRDFRYAPWLRGYGIAVVARTGNSTSASYYWNLSALNTTDSQTMSMKIDAPADVLPALGIGNSEGDTLVISAISHHRGETESVKGWVYVNTCPYPGMEGGTVTKVPPVEIKHPDNSAGEFRVPTNNGPGAPPKTGGQPAARSDSK